MEYGAERKISRHSVLGATVSVGVPQGVSLKIKSVQDLISFLQRLTITSMILFPVFRWEGASPRSIKCIDTSLGEGAAALNSNASCKPIISNGCFPLV